MSSPKRQVSLLVLPLPGVPLAWSAKPRFPSVWHSAVYSSYHFLFGGPTCSLVNSVSPLAVFLICGAPFCAICRSQPYWTCAFYMTFHNSEFKVFFARITQILSTLFFFIFGFVSLFDKKKKNFSEYKIHILELQKVLKIKEHIKKLGITHNSFT